MQFALSILNIPIIQCAYASDRKKSERYQKQEIGFNTNKGE